MDISASNWATELIKKNKRILMVNLYGAESLFKPHIYHSFLLKPGCVKK